MSLQRPIFVSLTLAALACLSLASAAPERLVSRPLPATQPEKTNSVGDTLSTKAGQRLRRLLPDRTMVFLQPNSTLQIKGIDRVSLTAGEAFFETAGGKLAPTLLVQTPKREVRAAAGRFGVRIDDDGTTVLVASGEARVGGVEKPLRAGQVLEAKSDKPVTRRISHLVEWTRDLRQAAPLVPASAHAGGSLIARDPDGQEARLELRKFHIDVHIEDGFARTTIEQTYFNHTQDRLEGTFRFPLPADASLSRLAMYVDGQLMEGGMAERDHARSVYERIVWEKRDPALLEWIDGSTFKMRIFPLEPRQEKRLLLSYTQRLPVLDGTMGYRFPAGHSLTEVGRWSLHVRVKGGAALGWQCASHALAARKDKGDLILEAGAKQARLDKDVVLSLSEPLGKEPDERARFSTVEQDGSKYLLVRYRPDLPGGAAPQRRDWVILVETSADRDPLLARTQIELVRSLLACAAHHDTFTLVTTATRSNKLQPKPIANEPAAVQEAIAALEKAHLVGALDLGRALADVRPLLEAVKEPHLLHVGSGIAAMGEQRTDELLKRLPKGTRYIGVGVGKRWNRAWMQSAAEATGGYFCQVNPDEPIAWRGFDLAMTLNTPRLLDVKVSDPEGKVSFLSFGRLVAQGEEVAAVARFTGEIPEKVRISGRLEGRAFVRDLPVKDVRDKADYLPRSWAKLEIDRLLAEDAPKHRKRIVELSKSMYVMSPFTSLLVLENEDMYTRFKVDRGRKDHWAAYPAPAKIKVVFEPLDGDPGDPKKGIKPSAQVVMQSIETRSAARVLRMREVDTAILRASRKRVGRAANPDVLDLADGENRERAVFEAVGLRLVLPRPSISIEALNAAAAVGGENFRDRIMAGRPFLKVYTVPAGTAEALAKTLQQAYSREASVRITFMGASKVLIYAPPEEQTEIGKHIESGAIRDPGLLPKFLDPDSNNLSGQDIAAGAEPLLRGVHYDLPDERAHVPMPSRPAGGFFERFAIQAAREVARETGPLLYSRPSYSDDDQLFFDLLGYAPGLNTSLADLHAVIESEARTNPALRRGKIADGVAELFRKGRSAGWRSLMVPASKATKAYAILFDGAGRFAWERTLPNGLRERVVCDGKTLWHLYPELGLAARRNVSRFHRLEWMRSLPWVLPLPEDLAHGADLKRIADDTVAIVPHGAREQEGKGKGKSSARHGWELHLIFKDGRLAERRWLSLGEKKVVRQTFSADGTVKHLDEKDKEMSSHKWTIEEAREPSLKPELKDLVVVDLPFRSPAQVTEALKLQKKSYADLTFDEARRLLTAFVAAGNGEQARQVFGQALANREQRQIGYYVLLAAAGVNLDGDNLDVLDAHPHEPLAQYLALHSSGVLRKHASRWAAASNPFEGLLHRLALGHAFCQRWSSGKSLGASAAQRGKERQRALEYAKKHVGTALAWALLGLVADRTAEEKDQAAARTAWRELATAYGRFAETPRLAEHARYEQARCLFRAGQKTQARKRFLDLHEQAAKQGNLLTIDADFRSALLDGGTDEWSALMRRTAVALVKDKKRFAVILLARQAWQLDDTPLSQELFTLALEGVPAKGKEGLSLHRAALAFLMETSQTAAADRLVGKLLQEKDNARRPELWRIAAGLAESRERPARRLECLEKALELEFENLPEVINLEQVRTDYGALLNQYQQLTRALATLKLPAPDGFRDKVVRAADRWRALDRDQEKAAQAAAAVLRSLGERELAWDYLTTPVALRPGDSAVWSNLAAGLQRQGERDLADRAWHAAFQRESTNAQLLWDRAENLRQAGKLTAARRLYRQIAEGDWQPRFDSLKSQAKWRLDR